MPQIDPSDILTPDELSKRLKVKKTWVYEKLRPHQKNPLPCFRIGHHLRFNWASVCSWLESTSNTKPKAPRKAAA
jgi:excisionase family DNA binding protein